MTHRCLSATIVSPLCAGVTKIFEMKGEFTNENSDFSQIFPAATGGDPAPGRQGDHGLSAAGVPRPKSGRRTAN